MQRIYYGQVVISGIKNHMSFFNKNLKIFKATKKSIFNLNDKKLHKTNEHYIHMDTICAIHNTFGLLNLKNFTYRSYNNYLSGSHIYIYGELKKNL